MKNIKLLTTAIFALLLAACAGDDSGGGGSAGLSPNIIDGLQTSNEFIATKAANNAAAQAVGGINQSSTGNNETTTRFSVLHIGGESDSPDFSLTKQGGDDTFFLIISQADSRTPDDTLEDQSYYDGGLIIYTSGDYLVERLRGDGNKYAGVQTYSFAKDSDSWILGGTWNSVEFANGTPSEFLETGAFVDGITANVVEASVMMTVINSVAMEVTVQISQLPLNNVEVTYKGFNPIVFDSAAASIDDNAGTFGEAVIKVNFDGDDTKMMANDTTFLNGEVKLNTDILWDTTNLWFSGENVLVCGDSATICHSIGGSRLSGQFFGENNVGLTTNAPDYLGGTFSLINLMEAGSNDMHTGIGSFITIEQDDN